MTATYAVIRASDIHAMLVMMWPLVRKAIKTSNTVKNICAAASEPNAELSYSILYVSLVDMIAFKFLYGTKT
ncbi:hypothetical protein thsrh120_25050 [Rhizobium sp. No.120]